jgi:hypothetical protein
MNFLIFLAIHGWWNFNKGLKICKFYLIWFKVESIERSKILTNDYGERKYEFDIFCLGYMTYEFDILMYD